MCQILFCNKVAVTRAMRQVFSCEFYEVFKEHFFQRTPPVTASGSCNPETDKSSFILTNKT